MALHMNKIVFVISLSFFLISSEANTISHVSYISSTPDVSPVASPVIPTETADVAAGNSNGVSVKNLVGSLMVSSITKTEDFVNKVVEKRLAQIVDAYKKDCLETCKEVYEDAVDAMKETLEDVNEGNYYKANVDVSTMSSNMETCNECVNAIYGQDPEFTKFDNWAHAIIEDALTRITSVSS
ncbi:PREDICTED: uncharacterized protein LOC109214334 [Nicotiana attenuata]|uniref:Pectinesterase inhibitor domain-containing protein n=1 Tax=Nicotiana attenuata TaxID=49451 RepID=A0A1J6L7S0_NICAT|nr:PREDICTED: uncharacterized protein LOC109214334 [Nicotiana attenuata]OIT27153.1 hypothetical protein A4A49_23516 [Nicotiana attenuata]